MHRGLMIPFSKMAGELVKKNKDLHFSISSRILVPLGNNMEDKKKIAVLRAGDFLVYKGLCPSKHVLSPPRLPGPCGSWDSPVCLCKLSAQACQVLHAPRGSCVSHEPGGSLLVCKFLGLSLSLRSMYLPLLETLVALCRRASTGPERIF